MTVPGQGQLREHPLSALLMGLYRRRATGTLAVTSQGTTKKIYLLKGEAIFASSTYEDDRLGEMLLKAGKISVEQYDRSVEALKRTGKRQGAILVDLGFLTPKDLFWGVKYQVREIIYSLFQLEDGFFEFIEGPPPKDEVITLKMSMGNLIYDGLKRIENWTRIRREMPDTEAVLKLSDDPLSLFQGVELGQQDKKILALIDGRKPIKKIIEDSWLNSFEALKALYLLWSLGMVEAGAPGERPEVSLDTVLAPISEEEEAFLTKVNNIYERLDSLDHFELLEVPESAGSEEIRKNYYALAKEFHPDRFFDSTDSMTRDKLSRIFDSVTDAYNAIKDEDGRRSYLASIGSIEAAASADTQKAEAGFKKAIGLIKAGKPGEASELLSEAVRIDPGNAEYWNYLALALSKLKGRTEEAEAALLKAVSLEPASSEYYSNLGLLYLKAKRTAEAKNQFAKALALDPDNEKAKKGMEKIG